MKNILTIALILVVNGLMYHCLGQQNPSQSNSKINMNNPQVGQFNIISGLDIGHFGHKPFRSDSYQILDSIASIIDSMNLCVFQIEFHTDCRADSDYNLAYTQRLADSTVALIERKIHSGRVIAIGKGENEPINNCNCSGDRSSFCREEEIQKNRRMQIRIIKLINR